MAGELKRVEVFLDDSPQPFQVLEAAPFTLRLDTAGLSDGWHSLRLVSHFTDGLSQAEERRFEVRNPPRLAWSGLQDGSAVGGVLELAPHPQAAEPESLRAGGLWPYVLAAALVLGGVWAVFALSGAGTTITQQVAELQPPNQATPTGGSQASSHSPADPALFSAGQTLYAQSCAGCHQASGGGLVGAFPPLAGNPNLTDAALVVRAVRNGKQGSLSVGGQTYSGAMPAVGATWSDAQVAGVATYVRNAWGNRFGGVAAAEVPRLLAASGGSPSSSPLGTPPPKGR